MRVFILAAGFGKRMGEYTLKIPKPMLEIDGIRLIDYALMLARDWGADQAIVNTHYLAYQIENHLRSFHAFPLFISYEPEILGTGGGIFTGIRRYWKDLFSESRSNRKSDYFLVMNPDTILIPRNKMNASGKFYPDLIMEKTVITSSTKGSTLPLSHLYLKELPEDATYTGLFLKDGKVKFHPTPESVPCYYIGLSIFQIAAFRGIDFKAGENFELGSIWKKLAEQDQLTGEIFEGDAIDIGEKEFYESVQFGNSIFDGKENEIRDSIRSMFSLNNI
ncbi:NTP transferase domain-containing protein [Leptospira sp. GIMC2001]|uniref:NTP transferase domain-containing protein n=1 Tax=Leptospira sp. GIMC2001 TaxID=1513297 RepID=UPI00234BF7A3|nr:NTP transferase domain-containing protein [Leptospira sp. GIMC2001]WCL49825.1 NTP transferase domain-containing protein [Leptospira sp. GIMC2001]